MAVAALYVWKLIVAIAMRKAARAAPRNIGTVRSIRQAKFWSQVRIAKYPIGQATMFAATTHFMNSRESRMTIPVEIVRAESHPLEFRRVEIKIKT